MAWTYTPSDLATNEIDQIRLEVADTDPNNPLLQNEEIQHAIDVEQNFWGAASRSAEYISRIFLRKADVKLGRAMQITYTKMAEQYLQMSVLLRKKALGTEVPYVGGISVSAKVLYVQDSDIVTPIFARNMQQNPWTGGYTPDTLPPVGNQIDDAGVQFVG